MEVLADLFRKLFCVKNSQYRKTVVPTMQIFKKSLHIRIAQTPVYHQNILTKQSVCDLKIVNIDSKWLS